MLEPLIKAYLCVINSWFLLFVFGFVIGSLLSLFYFKKVTLSHLLKHFLEVVVNNKVPFSK